MEESPVIPMNEDAVTCSVYMCSSSSDQSSPPEFYRFPKELERCSIWVKRCSKSEVSGLFRRHGTRRLHSRRKVCSEHFQERDFQHPTDKSKGYNIYIIICVYALHLSEVLQQERGVGPLPETRHPSLHSRSKVCSEHFQERDFQHPTDKSKGLKSDAVPSRNLQTCSSSASISSRDSSPYSSDGEQPDSPVCADAASNVIQDDSSDSWEDSKEGALKKEAAVLERRLLERKNWRLKRDIERLRRQNVRYKKKLT